MKFQYTESQFRRVIVFDFFKLYDLDRDEKSASCEWRHLIGEVQASMEAALGEPSCSIGLGVWGDTIAGAYEIQIALKRDTVNCGIAYLVVGIRETSNDHVIAEFNRYADAIFLQVQRFISVFGVPAHSGLKRYLVQAA